MPARSRAIESAVQAGERQYASLVRDCRLGRLNACLSQDRVADAVGVSRQLLTAWESRDRVPTPPQLFGWAAAVGLDLSIRSYPSGSPLRDAGQLRLLARFRDSIGSGWRWRSEVAISADPRERRSFDAVIDIAEQRAAVEAVTRLIDVQAQVRSITLKQEAAAISIVLLVLNDSRQNRHAVKVAEPILLPSFPTPPRAALAALRAGRLPPANAIVLI